MDKILQKRLEKAEAIARKLPPPKGKPEQTHYRGVCRVTGKRYSVYEKYVNTLGPMSGFAGREYHCTECDGILWRDGEWS